MVDWLSFVYKLSESSSAKAGAREHLAVWFYGIALSCRNYKLDLTYSLKGFRGSLGLLIRKASWLLKENTLRNENQDLEDIQLRVFRIFCQISYLTVKEAMPRCVEVSPSNREM